MADLIALARQEIETRHRFFVHWYTGEVGLDAMEETARCFGKGFRMVWPDGSMHERAAVVEFLSGLGGSKKPGSYGISVEIQHGMLLAPGLVLVCFDEHQRTPDGPNQRRATALFSPDADAPSGVVWRHLHQTWITNAN